MVASIDEISDEDVASVLDVTAWVRDCVTCAEELQNVEELTVDVTADCDGASNGLHIGLLEEDFLGFFAEMSEILLVEAFGLEQVGYALINVHLFQIFSKLPIQLLKTPTVIVLISPPISPKITSVELSCNQFLYKVR